MMVKKTHSLSIEERIALTSNDQFTELKFDAIEKSQLNIFFVNLLYKECGLLQISIKKQHSLTTVRSLPVSTSEHVKLMPKYGILR